MAKKDIKFTLDTIDSRYSPVGTVKQLDSVFFYIKITENGVTKDLTGQTIKLFAIKEDKKIVEQTTKINITNQREGLVEIELLNAAIQVHGFTYFELEISDSNGIISTSDFILRVNKRVGSDEAIESTNEVAILKKIEEYVAQAKVELQEFKKLQTEMIKTNETINNQEDLRADSELQRVEAENARAVAEEERRSAEQTREENFAHFENKINANTEELKAARFATTGEEFNTLDERIDCEVERINKKIEISFLEQEDKKSHTIETTIEGMTTDMIIKGRTLQNIVKEGKGPFTIDKNQNPSSRISEFIPIYNIEKGKNYVGYILVNNIENVTQGIRIYGIGISSAGAYGSIGSNTGIIKFTWNTSESKVNSFNKIGIYIDSSDFDNGGKVTFSDFMLFEQGTAIDNIDRYFEGIKFFGQQEGNKIISLSCGKNLMNPKKLNESVEILRNEITFSSNSKNINEFSGKEKTQYTFSCKVKKNLSSSPDNLTHTTLSILYIDGSKKNVRLVDTSQPSGVYVLKTVTSDPLKTVIGFSVWGYDNTSTFSDFIIEEGTKITTSKLYEEDKKEIELFKYGFTEGLKEIKIVRDELNYLKNEAIKRIEKYIFTGDESFQNWLGTPQDTEYCYFYLDNVIKYNLSNNNLICNILKVEEETTTKTEMVALRKVGDVSRIYISILKSRLTSNDLTGFKRWIKENNFVIYYELATPVKTPLNKNINLKTFGEKTYVNFENELSGTSSFKAPVNAAATISRLNRENKALEEENLKLKENMIETSKSLIEVDTNIIATNWDIDYRVCEIEWTLEDMGGSSPVNFKLLKKGVGNMALSRYEQAKIMILGGAYEKDTLTRQLDAYLKRKYVSQEEYDELIALMEARDMVTNQ